LISSYILQFNLHTILELKSGPVAHFGRMSSKILSDPLNKLSPALPTTRQKEVLFIIYLNTL